MCQNGSAHILFVVYFCAYSVPRCSCVCGLGLPFCNEVFMVYKDATFEFFR